MTTPYNADKKSTGLDVLTTLASGDLHIVGDVSDSGFAKAITQANLVTTLESVIDLGNLQGQIDLTTQVTGLLPAANINIPDLTSNSAFQTAVNSFVSGGGESTTGIYEGTYFDDFTNWLLTDNTSGTNFHASGNFYSPSSSNTYSTETDHPGIVTIPQGPGNVADVIGFIAGGQSGSGDGGVGLIPVGSNFKFTYVGRSTRTGAAFDTAIGLTDDTSQYDVFVRFNNTQSATKVAYYNGAGPVVSAIDLPTSGAWFTLIFDYVAATNTLTITLDGQTVFSGAAVFADTQVGFRFGNVGGTAGTKLDTDSVRTETRPDTTTGIQTKTVSLSSAQILAIHTTPIELIAAQGAGTVSVIDRIVYSLDAGTQYANGDSIAVVYDGASTPLVKVIEAGDVTSATDVVKVKRPVDSGGDNLAITAGINQSVKLQQGTPTAFITGTGTVKLIISYQVVTI